MRYHDPEMLCAQSASHRVHSHRDVPSMPSASACLAYDTPQAFGTFGHSLFTPTLPAWLDKPASPL